MRFDEWTRKPLDSIRTERNEWLGWTVRANVNPSRKNTYIASFVLESAVYSWSGSNRDAQCRAETHTAGFFRYTMRNTQSHTRVRVHALL